MVPEAPGTAASEVVRAEVSVVAEAWVLEESGATQEEWAASKGSEPTSTARHAEHSPYSRQLSANVGPQRLLLFRLTNPQGQCRPPSTHDARDDGHNRIAATDNHVTLISG